MKKHRKTSADISAKSAVAGAITAACAMIVLCIMIVTGSGTANPGSTDPGTNPDPTTPPSVDPQQNTPFEPVPDGPYEPSENGYAMLKKSVFIGDSICLGISHYDVLPDENVCAVGSLSAFNVFWYGKFGVNGTTYGIEDAMRHWYIDPEYIFFSMGMNDIHMGTEEEFTNNYKALIDAVHAVKPNAALAVCSITPISASSEFDTNETIDRYNAALKAFCDSYGVKFVDVSTLLKDESGNLREDYHSGDGLHLKPDAYKTMLYRVCCTMGW